MIKFFRKIRRNLLSENKFSKYLIYAIGEIVLVVIGILIALAINNWNNKIQQKDKLIANFKSIIEEVSYVSSITENRIKRVDLTISQNQKSLQILKNKDIDSVFKLKQTLIGLISLSDLKFDLPFTMEFISNDDTKEFQNNELKNLLLKLKSQISFLNTINNYARNQYQNLIEPYVVDNLNYAEIQIETTINVNESINYTALLKDLKLSNILNLKLETDVLGLEQLKELNLTLKNLKKRIQQEINKK